MMRGGKKTKWQGGNTTKMQKGTETKAQKAKNSHTAITEVERANGDGQRHSHSWSIASNWAINGNPRLKPTSVRSSDLSFECSDILQNVPDVRLSFKRFLDVFAPPGPGFHGGRISRR